MKQSQVILVISAKGIRSTKGVGELVVAMPKWETCSWTNAIGEHLSPRQDM